MHMQIAEGVTLTTDSAASSYGAPVLRIVTDGHGQDYGPGDLVIMPGGIMVAAEIAQEWVRRPGHTTEEHAAVRAFVGAMGGTS